LPSDFSFLKHHIFGFDLNVDGTGAETLTLVADFERTG